MSNNSFNIILKIISQKLVSICDKCVIYKNIYYYEDIIINILIKFVIIFRIN